MKHLYYIIFTLICLVYALGSCSTQTNTSSISNKVDTLSITIGIDTTYIIAPEDKYSPYLHLSVSYDCPMSDTTLVKTLNYAVFDSIAQPTANATIIEYTKRAISTFLLINEGWKEDLDTTSIYSTAESSRPYGEENSQTLNITKVYQDDRLVSFLSHSFGYSFMAAHGWNNNSYITIDLNTNKVLIDEDIFVKDYKDTLGKIIIKQLMNKYNVNTFDRLVDEAMIMVSKDNILPNNNFYISNDGLVYCYNKYEISSYAAGVIEVTIPFGELKDVVPETSPIYYLVNS